MKREKVTTKQDDVLSITQKEVIDYFTSKVQENNKDNRKHYECPVCLSHHWGGYPYPDDNTKPVIVATPIPFAKHGSMWYFSIFCSNCGYTIQLDVNVVTKNILKQRENKE